MAGSQQSRMSWSDASDVQLDSLNGQEMDVSNGTPTKYVAYYSQHDVQVQSPITLPLPNSLSSGVHGDPPVFETDILPASGLQSLSGNGNARESERLYGPWYQNTFSSINWLPDNWTPEFQMNGTGDSDSFHHNQYPNLRQITQASEATHSNTSERAILSMPSHQDQIPGHGYQPRPVSQQLEDQEFPSSGSQNSPGHYYVDGDGARLPRVRKAPYQVADSSITTSPQEALESPRGFFFPELDESDDNMNLSNIQQIPETIYSEILRIFDLTCISSTHYAPFQSGTFPSLRALSWSVRLYVNNFQPILPFMHPATFNLLKSHWLFILVVAAIGNHYTESKDRQLLVVAAHEFAHRAIQMVVENSGKQKPDNLVLTQVKLLNCVGMMYCGDERLMKSAKMYHSNLVEFCNTEWTRSISFTYNDLSDSTEQVCYDWKLWYEAETRRRTGYCIWLLDCMWAFHFQMRPLLSLVEASAPIPCQEVLWEAESALDWKQLYDSSTPSPSLHSAIQLAYIEKRLQSSMGEFSRILCIHALFRRTWEVENYFSQPLTLWNPTAEKQDISLIEQSIPVWLPNIQTYSKWRNSACDVLDILHWHANSVIGAASGMEHPTVLHLHLARVILLPPFRQIVRLAYIMSGEISPDAKLDIASTRNHIQRWALEDQHKARLAMVHAGVLFWHVRRYSTDAFYEPSSVFAATLVLWAYGTFAARTPGTNEDGEPSREHEDAESLFPTSMQLDRPADDELVQLFVKRGASMRANITGVGNLCSAKGPVRVLIEGRNLLLGLKRWGYSQRAIRLLNSIIEACQQ